MNEESTSVHAVVREGTGPDKKEIEGGERREFQKNIKEEKNYIYFILFIHFKRLKEVVLLDTFSNQMS